MSRSVWTVVTVVTVVPGIMTGLGVRCKGISRVQNRPLAPYLILTLLDRVVLLSRVLLAGCACAGCSFGSSWAWLVETGRDVGSKPGNQEGGIWRSRFCCTKHAAQPTGHSFVRTLSLVCLATVFFGPLYSEPHHYQSSSIDLKSHPSNYVHLLTPQTPANPH